MAHRWANNLKHSDVTPEPFWLNRRKVIAGALGAGVLGSISSPAMAQTLEPNSWEDITNYNNYYEFGTNKEDPAENAHRLNTANWVIEVDGMVDAPGRYSVADLIDGLTVEERIYRFRCVEAWSMVVPWNGFELKDILDKVGVQSEAKYVAFETALRPDEMPGVRYNVLDWPYREGLRLDEALHPLTMMATGIYGKPIPNQNGAPIRLVVPWKYGFKSIKSIVRITLTDKEPLTSWGTSSPREYGFYSNVNPAVNHPRWSQATERKIGGGLFNRRHPTLMFNGYQDEVMGLYDGMNLTQFF
ncbi:MAG: protein-methionine-sulfoxide reductase catalytic subunit MsrP [Planktomarina sp.]|nr:protein-methionine-sulfoxide reductase catalytic subunit MsrP [Planktomarina sp.]|tara:strand:- start:1021 stop:1923 length:903 start_codon:yes stop_codon:yes gene_type:complete